MFKTDDCYPNWRQNPERPIIDGVPLVFKGQVEDRNNYALFKYYFYHPETKEETIVEQYN